MKHHVICALAAVLLLTGQAWAQRLEVTATIFPVADAVSRIGGDAVAVHTLLPPGRGPHTFEPTPGDAKRIAASRIVFMSGFGLDDWLGGIIAAAGSGGADVVDLSRGVSRRITGGHDHGHDHDHGTVNPHYWLDPSIMADLADLIAGALAKRLPDRAGEIGGRAAEYKKSMMALDAAIADRLSSVRAGFVAFHGAWDYFAARYGLEMVGVIEESPGREPSARKIVQLAETIKRTGARAVVVEPQFSPRLGEALAREAGVAVVTADPVGGGPGRDSYEKLMMYNAGKFYEALR